MADRTVGEALDEYINAGFSSKEIEAEFKKKGVDILKADPKAALSSLEKRSAEPQPAKEAPFVAPKGDIGPSPFEGVPKVKSTVEAPKPEDPAWYATLGMAKQPDRVPSDTQAPTKGLDLTWHPQAMLEGLGKGVAESIEKPERLWTPLSPAESFPTKKSKTGTVTVFPSKGPVPGVRPSGKLPVDQLPYTDKVPGESLLKLGNVGKTAKVGQEAKAAEDKKRNEEDHPVMRFLSDLGETAAGVPQMLYQFLPHPNESESEAKARGEHLGKGVAEGLIGGTKQMLEHPVDTFSSRPFSTTLQAVPAAAAAGKLVKLSLAGDAVAYRPRVHQVDVPHDIGPTSPAGSAAGLGPELLPDLPPMPPPRAPSVLDKAADVVHDFIQDRIAPDRTTRAMATVKRWFTNPRAQTTESATAVVDELLRDATNVSEAAKKGLVRLFEAALDEGKPIAEATPDAPSVPITPVGSTLSTAEGTHVSLPPTDMPTTPYAVPRSNAHLRDVVNRVEHAKMGVGADGVPLDTEALVRGPVTTALAEHLNAELQGGKLLGSAKFAEYLARKAGPEITGGKPSAKWLKETSVALKNASTGDPSALEWQYTDKAGNLQTVDISKHVQSFLGTPQGKAVLRASAAEAVESLAGKIGAGLAQSKLHTIAETSMDRLARVKNTWNPDQWLAFTDDFLALPKGGDKATVLRDLQQVLADPHTSVTAKKYLPKLMEKINRFVKDATTGLEVDPGLASTLKSELAVASPAKVWPWIAELNGVIAKNLTSRNLPGHLNNSGSNFSMQATSYGNPFKVAQNWAETIEGWSHYVRNAKGMKWSNLATQDHKVYRALEDMGIAERDMLHDMGQSQIAPLRGMDWLYQQGDNIPKLDEASRNLHELLDGLSALKEGDYIQHPVSNGREVRVTLDRVGPDGPRYLVDSLGERGTRASGTTRVVYGKQEQQLYRVLAEMAAKPAFDKFVDFSDMPQAFKAVKDLTRYAPIVGAFQPFFTWAWKMTDLPGKAGAGYHTLVAPLNYSTNNATLLAKQAAKYSSIAAQRALLQQSVQGALRDTRDGEALTHLFDFTPTEVKYSLLTAMQDPRFVGILPLGNYNFVAPTEGAVRAAANVWDTMTRDKDETRSLTRSALTKAATLTAEDKKRIKYLQYIDSGQLSSPEDVLKLIGLSKTPILSSLDKVLERSKKGEHLDAADYNQIFGSALYGGTAARMVDIGAGISQELGAPTGFTTRKYEQPDAASMTEPFAPWVVKRLTGVGWNYKNVYKALEGDALKTRATGLASALDAAPQDIKKNLSRYWHYKSTGKLASAEVAKKTYQQSVYFGALSKAAANQMKADLMKKAAVLHLPHSMELPFPGEPTSTDDVQEPKATDAVPPMTVETPEE